WAGTPRGGRRRHGRLAPEEGRGRERRVGADRSQRSLLPLAGQETRKGRVVDLHFRISRLYQKWRAREAVARTATHTGRCHGCYGPMANPEKVATVRRPP